MTESSVVNAWIAEGKTKGPWAFAVSHSRFGGRPIFKPTRADADQ